MKKSTKRFVLSDETKNLFEFITVTSGIDLSAFSDNPVMLYNHDYDKLIGQWIDYRIEGTQLTAAPAFDENDAYAMQQYSKVEAGILKGASIGISPIQFDELSGKMVKCLLLEASLTPVPNNRKALAIYNNAGKKLNASEAKQYLLSVKLETDNSDFANHGSIDNVSKIDAAILKTPALSTARSALIYIAENTPNELSVILDSYADRYRLNAVTINHNEKSYDDYALNAPKELELMQSNDPTRFEKLVADKVASINLSGQMASSGYYASQNNQSTVKFNSAGKLNTYDEYALNAPKELELMQSNDPARFEKLVADKVRLVRLSGQVLTDGY